MNRGLLIYFILTMPIFISGCPKNIPIWNKKIYHANPDKMVFERAQDNETIPFSDPRVKNMVGIFVDDWNCSIETYIINATGWDKQSACGLQPTNSNPTSTTQPIDPGIVSQPQP